IGGLVGGQLYGLHYPNAVFIFCAIFAGIWFILALKMHAPRPMVTLMLNLGAQTDAQAKQLTERLRKIEGVLEAQVMSDDGI
ncbi:hypothetical protein ABTD90_21005, partial [Acinetobacter baumannii]